MNKWILYRGKQQDREFDDFNDAVSLMYKLLDERRKHKNQVLIKWTILPAGTSYE